MKHFHIWYNMYLFAHGKVVGFDIVTMFFALFSDLFFQLVLMLMILDIHAHNDKPLIFNIYHYLYFYYGLNCAQPLKSIC